MLKQSAAVKVRSAQNRIVNFDRVLQPAAADRYKRYIVFATFRPSLFKIANAGFLVLVGQETIINQKGFRQTTNCSAEHAREWI